MTFRPVKGCFNCGTFGHLAVECPSENRLCYNCAQPGHESSACTSPKSETGKQCYSCGGVGHLRVACPNLRVAQQAAQTCFTCGRVGHIARTCNNNNGAGVPQGSRVDSRSLKSSTLGNPVIRCHKCHGPNHFAKNCLAPLAPLSTDTSNKTCYKCQTVGHIARNCTNSPPEVYD